MEFSFRFPCGVRRVRLLSAWSRSDTQHDPGRAVLGRRGRQSRHLGRACRRQGLPPAAWMMSTLKRPAPRL